MPSAMPASTHASMIVNAYADVALRVSGLVQDNRAHAELAEALRAELAARPPTLLVVSGDLTQRARRAQFAAAAA